MRLPSAYQEVEYIESSGTQYIDTGCVFAPQQKIELNATWLNSSDPLFFGANSSDKEIMLRYYDGTYRNFFGGTFAYTFDINTNYNIVFDFKNTTSNMKLTINNTVVQDAATSDDGANGKKIYLFGGIHTNSSTTIDSYCSMKVFNMEIIDSSQNIIRNFVPCYRKSDDVIGLYDTVNDTFYTNSGTGTFTKGPNVEYPPEYRLHGAIQTFHWKRPYEWKPGANTFGYYTFDDQNANQITDFSGNNRNLTGGTMPTYTLVSGTNYAGDYTNVSGSVAPSVSYATLDSEFTMLVWVKVTTNSSSYIDTIHGVLSSNANQQISLIYGYNSGQFEYYDSYNPTGSIGGETVVRTTIKSGATTNTWYLVGFVRGDGVLKTYCNGVAGATGTYQVSSIAKTLYLGSSNLGDRLKGQIGECVVEDKVRTAQEITNYYNRSKSNYGL